MTPQINDVDKLQVVPLARFCIKISIRVYLGLPRIFVNGIRLLIHAFKSQLVRGQQKIAMT